MRRREAIATVLCSMVPVLVWQRPAAGAAWLRPPALPDAPLIDHEGRSRRLADLLRGRAVVVSFFFTGCGTVCPAQTALLLEARRQWQARPALRDALIVSITVDPLGDGPAQLRGYAQRFGLPIGESGGWVLLTGAPREVDKVLAVFEVPSGRPEEHLSLLWLGDEPRGRWTRTSALNPPQVTGQLFEELRR